MQTLTHTHWKGPPVQPLNYTITQRPNCPQQELFICLCRRIIRPLLFCGSLSGDERTIKHYCCRRHGRSIPGLQSTARIFFFPFLQMVWQPLGCVIVYVSACLAGASWVGGGGGCGQLVKQAPAVPCSDFNCTVKSDLAL